MVVEETVVAATAVEVMAEVPVAAMAEVPAEETAEAEMVVAVVMVVARVAAAMVVAKVVVVRVVERVAIYLRRFEATSARAATHGIAPTAQAASARARGKRTASTALFTPAACSGSARRA